MPIEEISEGDQVLAWNVETGDVALKSVTETYINEADGLVHIQLESKENTCTPSHSCRAAL